MEVSNCTITPVNRFCELIVYITRHPRALFQEDGMPPLFSELGAMRRHHHMMGQRLSQLDLLSMVCARFNMLNTNETAHFSQYKHREGQKPLAPFIR